MRHKAGANAADEDTEEAALGPSANNLVRAAAIIDEPLVTLVNLLGLQETYVKTNLFSFSKLSFNEEDICKFETDFFDKGINHAIIQVNSKPVELGSGQFGDVVLGISTYGADRSTSAIKTKQDEGTSSDSNADFVREIEFAEKLSELQDTVMSENVAEVLFF